MHGRHSTPAEGLLRLLVAQRVRWQRWRAGIEGRMHSLRRDDGLTRVRSHGAVGQERDIGWGVFASDLRHVASAQVQRQRLASQRAA